MLQSRPLVRSAFCPKEIEHIRGLTLHLCTLDDFDWIIRKLTLHPKRRYIRGPYKQGIPGAHYGTLIIQQPNADAMDADAVIVDPDPAEDESDAEPSGVDHRHRGAIYTDPNRILQG